MSERTAVMVRMPRSLHEAVRAQTSKEECMNDLYLRYIEAGVAADKAKAELQKQPTTPPSET